MEIEDVVVNYMKNAAGAKVDEYIAAAVEKNPELAAVFPACADSVAEHIDMIIAGILRCENPQDVFCALVLLWSLNCKRKYV